MTLGVTIRFGAGERTVTVDDQRIDRNTLTKDEDKTVRRIIREASLARGLVRG